MVIAASTQPPAFGHGDPILLGLTGNKLAVSQPSGSFPTLIFGQGGSAGLPNEDVTFLPGLGEIVYWDLPGMDIAGLSDTSRLSIEPLVRPVAGSPINEQRLVWYWNTATETVEPSDVDLYLLGVAPRFTTLSATTPVSPGPFLLADPLQGQQGFHNHGLLNYAVDNSSGAPAGLYGFFARFTSSVHESSDDFLIALNNGVASADVVAAAEAIHAAATALPGDFNRDGRVDAADYTVWRDGLGTKYGPDDYTLWKSHFGQSVTGPGSGAIATAIPEPHSVTMFAIAAIVASGPGVGFCRLRTPRYRMGRWN
jgi:hypothetical protein